MFAKFRLSEDSLDKLAEPRINKRTATGCLSCRSKKKKCDEQKPVCRRCNKWPFPPCSWPPPPHSPVLGGQGTPLSIIWRSIGDRPDPVNLARSFETAHAGPFTGSQVSFIEHYAGISLCPALTHAYAACGAAMLCLDNNGPWVQLSLFHYGEALKILSRVLKSDIHVDATECAMAVINSLHIFETLRHDTNVRNVVHIKAGRSLFLQKDRRDAIPTREQRLLKEEYAFQLVVLSTFCSDIVEDEDQYWETRGLLRSLQAPDPPMLSSSLFMLADMGISHELFGYVLQISALKRHVPLVGVYLDEALQIRAELHAWNHPEIPELQDVAERESLITMATMYRIGCQIYLAKIIDPFVTPEDPYIVACLLEGLPYVEILRGDKLDRASVLLWPIIMMGLASVNQQDRDTLLRPLSFLLETRGIGCIRGILSLLDHAWHDSNCQGLDVLFMDDLLSTVVF